MSKTRTGPVEDLDRKGPGIIDVLYEERAEVEE